LGSDKWKPAASMEVYSVPNRPGIPLGTLAIPVRDHINAATATAMLGTDYSWLPEGYMVNRWFIQGSILTMQRNEAIQRMEGDWLLFIDDDMVWDPTAVGRLVAVQKEYDLDMVGGLCFRRSDPHQPTMYMRQSPNEGSYNYLEKWDNDLVEVDATGMAFVLIHRRVLERIAGSPLPSLEERSGHPPSFFTWGGRYGEDLAFCQAAKASGSRIWVDTRIKIGHMGEIEIGEREYLYALATREKAIEDERRVVNDSMGLPTMTAVEAKERLGL
jgi:hypothetical protein